MYLLAIVIALCIERLVNPGFFLHRFSWFNRYVDYWYTRFAHRLIRGSAWQTSVSAYVLLLPLLLTVAIVFYGLGLLFYQMLQVLLAIAILTYCLGPEDGRRQLEGYIKAKQEYDQERAMMYLTLLLPNAQPDEDNRQTRALTEISLQLFVKQIFAVIFWFLVLGPVGAVLYRCSTMLARYALTHHQVKLLHASQTLVRALDWLPIRLLGFSFTIVGNFKASFKFILSQCLTGTNNNEWLLQNVGLLALGVDITSSNQASATENQDLLGLFDRVLIIWLVAIALITLGMLTA